jgi:CRP/FNR family cyclic AMP-dependent transcriptional regulator
MWKAADLDNDVDKIEASALIPNQRFGALEHSRISTIHPDGTVLFTEGQPAAGVYLVLGGTAKVSISSPQGKLLIIRVARAGDLLGINSTMTGFPYEATAQTFKKCRTSFIPRAEFISLQKRDERSRELVQVALGRYVSELIGNTRRLMLAETAAEKLASLLLRWSEEFGVVEPHGVRLVWEFTQEEVAQMICASRETVTRLLGEFSKRGLIHLRGHSLLLREPKGLEDIALKKSTLTVR